MHMTLSFVCVCVRVRVCAYDLSNSHPLYEKHITLQMTLLDGSGSFNYRTLMQSPVNTLKEAAEEEKEAASPSSIILVLICLTLYLWPLCHRRYIRAPAL